MYLGGLQGAKDYIQIVNNYIQYFLAFWQSRPAVARSCTYKSHIDLLTNIDNMTQNIFDLHHIILYSYTHTQPHTNTNTQTHNQLYVWKYSLHLAITTLFSLQKYYAANILILTVTRSSRFVIIKLTFAAEGRHSSLWSTATTLEISPNFCCRRPPQFVVVYSHST